MVKGTRRPGVGRVAQRSTGEGVVILGEAIVLALISGASAQSARLADVPPPPTKAPVVTPPGQRLVWVMRLEAKEPDPTRVGRNSDATDSEGIHAVRSIRNGNIKEDAIERADGSVRRIYWIGSLSLRETREGGTFSADFTNRTISSMSVPGFYGVDWVRPENFVATEEFGEGAAFRHRATHVLRGEREADDTTITRGAWIDPQTLRPLKIKGPDGEFVFEYPPGPVREVSPVPGALTTWNGVSKQLQKLGQRTPRVQGMAASEVQ